jgi:hypothetical protein
MGNHAPGVPLSLDLDDPSAVPYFLWDEPMPLAELEARLRSASRSERLRLLGRILREARDTDVWRFTTPAEVAAAWPELQRYLGRRRAFWQFLLRWAEPGINCETCHGPAAEHARVFETLKPGQKALDLKIVSVKRLSHEQRNNLCASCHAKASPLWTDFKPGDRFFDHFDLMTLENPDYYADGRDRGETAAHTHHKADVPGSVCTSCNMPMTEFARMRRSDHSMSQGGTRS